MNLLATFVFGLVTAAISGAVTYGVVKPGPDYCAPTVSAALQHQAALNQDEVRRAVDDALAAADAANEQEYQDAVRPREGLNPNRDGGIGWDDSIR